MFVGQDKETNEIVALKRINTEQEENGFPITAIREVKILKALRHENIVNLKEIVTSKGEWFLASSCLGKISVLHFSPISTRGRAVLLAHTIARLLSRSTALVISALYKPLRHLLAYLVFL